MHLNHYLNFNGQTEKAFLFYLSVFGGEFSHFQRMGDMPPGECEIAEHERNLVLHVSLKINAHTELMGSDHCGALPYTLQMGNNHFISINLEQDETEARRLFNQLSVHGHIHQQLEKTFWGALFGSFSDQFGVQWMVNCQLSDAP